MNNDTPTGAAPPLNSALSLHEAFRQLREAYPNDAIHIGIKLWVHAPNRPVAVTYDVWVENGPHAYDAKTLESMLAQVLPSSNTLEAMAPILDEAAQLGAAWLSDEGKLETKETP